MKNKNYWENEKCGKSLESKFKLFFLNFLMTFALLRIIFEIFPVNFLHDLNFLFESKLKLNLKINNGSDKILEYFLAVHFLKSVLSIDKEVLQIVIHRWMSVSEFLIIIKFELRTQIYIIAVNTFTKWKEFKLKVVKFKLRKENMV